MKRVMVVLFFLFPAVLAASSELTEEFEKDPIPLDSSTGSVSMTLMDFDSDGKTDGVAMMDGSGSRVVGMDFYGPVRRWSVMSPDITKGTSKGVIIAGDLDGDGMKSDVIAGSDNVYAISSAGSVIWEFVTTGSVYSLAAADLDGDGKPGEILVGGWKKVYAIDSNGNSIWNYTNLIENVNSVAVTDLDKDGIPESPVFGSGRSLYTLTSDGQFKSTKLLSDKVYSVVAADLDADGYATDVVTGGGDGNVTAFDSSGNTRWSYKAYLNEGEEISLYAADLGSKEILDYVVIKADTVHALRPDGTRIWPGTHVGDALAFVDFNNDGKFEGTVIGTSSRIYAINTAGRQVGYYLDVNDIKQDPYNNTGASALSAADLDGDGYLDDVFGVGNGLFYAIAHTTHAPAPATTAPPATTAAPVTTAPPAPKEVTVEIGEDKTVTGGTVVTLTADATPSLESGNIVSYIWTEDNKVLSQDRSLSKIFDEGEHTIKVEVIDNTGAKSADIIKITVESKAPETAAPAIEEGTSALKMVLLGVVIGVSIVGAILYFMKKKESEEEEWV